jgi:hypothetical protein
MAEGTGDPEGAFTLVDRVRRAGASEGGGWSGESLRHYV